jgi:hypothetical protein
LHPADWRVVVYEKCGLTTNRSSTGDAMFVDQPIGNAGAEECNGYLDYIIAYYNLTDVNIFIHDDALQPYSKSKGMKAHTSFHNFTQLVNATFQFMTKDQGFLHYGVRYITEKWGVDPSHGKAMQILWPFFATPKGPSLPKKSRSNHLHTWPCEKNEYWQTRWTSLQGSETTRLLQSIPPRQHKSATNVLCYGKRTWHMLFGEPPILSSHSIVTDRLNLTKCNHPDCSNPV